MAVAVWIVCFITGILLFLTGIVFFFVKRKNKINAVISSLFEFAACSVLLFPAVYTDIPSSGLGGLESFLTAILIVVTRYLGEGYEHITYVDQFPAEFFSIYSILIVVTNLLMLAFAADFVLQLAGSPYQLLRLKFNCRKRIFVLSECNDKTLAIAESIQSDTDYRIVFSRMDSELSADYAKRLESIGAITIKEDINEIFRIINGKSSGIEIFLFNNKEEQNLQQLGELCSTIEARSDIKVFVEVNRTHWSLYDEYIEKVTNAHSNLTINLVRTEENFVYNELLKESIFENAVDNSNIKQINVLIVGYNDRNLEFLKAVLHLGQMPGYELNITLIESGNHKQNINHIMPEIKEIGDGYGEAIYTFKHIVDIDYSSNAFNFLVRSLVDDYTFAYINAGDDLLNAEIAMSINMVAYREGVSEDKKILVNISNKSSCYKDKWNSTLIKNMKFVGDIEQVYDYGFITMSHIEKASMLIHEVRQKEKLEKDSSHRIQTWKEYCNNEYNRHSVYARTLSFVFKVPIIEQRYKDGEAADFYSVTKSDREWRVYEHMRWNVYTRTLGFVKAPELMLNEKGKVDRQMRNAAKVHQCLVPFDELQRRDQAKDEFTLTPEIVEILKNTLAEASENI